jgi:SulP family sulfate permease
MAIKTNGSSILALTLSDLTAGATVAAIAVPQAIAYALLAGVDPKFGLYSAIVNTIVAAILGSSSHLINGPTNAISLVVFSALASFDDRFTSFQALFLLGIAAGTLQILIGLARLGDLTRYVSESVVLGFMAGAGLLIGVGQVVNFLGTSDKGAGRVSDHRRRGARVSFRGGSRVERHAAVGRADRRTHRPRVGASRPGRARPRECVAREGHRGRSAG